ncbi:hypothetical protein JVT61DRAFT_958 [Boletus reticuloceps]|uniref:Uncharacterized protein n=1 Tax=Boletus reticuloceps TaxID=495285 RepID=A0A8I3ABW5_9AGAM|nr:hypothetical protein JVT61DRAFT_958 [Boletus reticuloceps]
MTIPRWLMDLQKLIKVPLVLFAELAARAGMPVYQVVSHYARLYSRSNLGNFWNMYQPYHMAHKAQELARLGEEDIVTATPMDKMAKCYKLFREKYPGTYQEILTTWYEAEALDDADKTIAQRAQLFSRLAKKLEQQCSAMAKSHAFEVSFVMGGSVVNQDASLGRVFSTEGAEGFFLERCRADTDEIIGHFKAHIFNRASLHSVSDAFEVDDAPEAPTRKNGDDERSRTDGDPDEREDHARVRSQCKWVSGKLFPWKNFPSKLSKSGFVCHGWPDNVLLLGEDRQPRPKGGSKGISDLTLTECSSLLAALYDTSKQGLHFKLVNADMKELICSRKPVILCAAPSSDPPHASARRMFANLTIDRKGLPRPENTAAMRMTLLRSFHQSLGRCDPAPTLYPTPKTSKKPVT